MILCTIFNVQSRHHLYDSTEVLGVSVNNRLVITDS